MKRKKSEKLRSKCVAKEKEYIKEKKTVKQLKLTVQYGCRLGEYKWGNAQKRWERENERQQKVEKQKEKFV